VKPAGRAALVAMVLGCGGGGTEPTDDAEFDFAFADPAGDTVAATTNPNQVRATDLLEITGRLDRQRLVLTLRFANPVTRWTDGGADALDGFVLFDSDTSSASGFANPAHGLGVDFYLDLRDDGFGKMAVVNFAKRRFERAEARFEDATVTVTIPRSFLTTDSDRDSWFRMAVDIAGRGRRPDVDASPTAGFHRIEPTAAP